MRRLRERVQPDPFAVRDALGEVPGAAAYGINSE